MTTIPNLTKLNTINKMQIAKAIYSNINSLLNNYEDKEKYNLYIGMTETALNECLSDITDANIHAKNIIEIIKERVEGILYFDDLTKSYFYRLEKFFKLSLDTDLLENEHENN